MAIAEAMAMVMVTISYDSQKYTTSWSSMTGLRFTELRQHYCQGLSGARNPSKSFQQHLVKKV